MQKGIVIVSMLIFLYGCIGSKNLQTDSYENVSSQNDTLLKRYEKNKRIFTVYKTDSLNIVSYYHPRKIGEVFIEGDFIKYQFNISTGKLIKKTSNWRNDLPNKFVVNISRNQALSLAKGKVRNSRLYLISRDSDVYDLDTVPDYPCWVVWSEYQGEITITIIDAMKGKILGYGVPPPFDAFAFHCDVVKGWEKWRDNADEYFEYEMGYETKRRTCPCDEELMDYIRSDHIALFYEISHGGSFSIHGSCPHCSTLSASEVETYMDKYPSIPLTFLASCGAMCDQSDNTMSFEFRKGLDNDAVVVGYCGMDHPPCTEDCWPDSRDWQEEFFESLSDGFTVGEAFNRAMLEFPLCNNCIRIAGDRNLIFAGDGIPKVQRSFSGTFYDIIPFISPLNPTPNRSNYRSYYIRNNIYIPENKVLTMVTTQNRPILDLVLMNDSYIISDGMVIIYSEAGEVSLTSYNDNTKGIKIRGNMKIFKGGKIRIVEN